MAKFEKGNKVGRQFQPGNNANPAGRPPKMATAWKAIPKDAQRKLYGVLYHAISLGSVEDAKKYLEETNAAEPGQYGIVLEVAIKSLGGQYGWQTLCDIYDRLFGKPRQQADVNVGGEVNFTFKFGGDQ